MNPGSADEGVRALVSVQIGRAPREPWSVEALCSFGFPTVIVSPSLLADGTPFPTWAWLTCPYLMDAVSGLESAGEGAAWAGRAASDPALAAALRALDADVRAARAREGEGEDSCGDVGLAGQRDPLGVKCLHAHVAYALVGLDDPVGHAVLLQTGRECVDARCSKLAPREEEDPR